MAGNDDVVNNVLLFVPSQLAKGGSGGGDIVLINALNNILSDSDSSPVVNIDNHEFELLLLFCVIE